MFGVGNAKRNARVLLPLNSKHVEETAGTWTGCSVQDGRRIQSFLPVHDVNDGMSHLKTVMMFLLPTSSNTSTKPTWREACAAHSPGSDVYWPDFLQWRGTCMTSLCKATPGRTSTWPTTSATSVRVCGAWLKLCRQTTLKQRLG